VFLELHIDGSLNFVALLAGECRYILSHPDQCKKPALLFQPIIRVDVIQPLIGVNLISNPFRIFGREGK